MASPLKVLLIEHFDSDAELILLQLKKLDGSIHLERVETAEALQLALSQAHWDLVISDYHLPAFSGPAALALLRENHLEIPFLLVSGTVNEETALSLLEAGAAEYVSKERLARLPGVVKRVLLSQELQHGRDLIYHQLSRNPTDIHFRYDMRPSLRLGYINPAVQLITGYSPEECYASPDLLMRIAHPADAAIMADMLRGQWSTVNPLCVRWIDKAGSTHWIESRAMAIRDESGVLLSVEGMARDITESKKLADTQSFLARHSWSETGDNFFQALALHLAENLEMDFVCIDQLEGEGLSAVTIANYYAGRFEENITYTLKDTPCGSVLGKSVCCYPNEVSRLFPLDSLLQEMRAESYVGATLWGSNGQPIGLIAAIGQRPLAWGKLAERTLELVSGRAASALEHKIAESALRKSEERFSQAMEATSDGLWDTNLETGTVYYSPNYAGMLGYDLDEFQREVSSWVDLIHPEDLNRTLAANQDCIENRVQSFAVEFRMKTRSGDWKWILGRGKALARDAQGRAVRLIGTHVDITERKRAEEALERRILALTQPLDQTKSVAFEELFNLQDIQRLQDEFANATGVASIITHPDGTPITEPSNFTQLCSGMIRKTKKGQANCFRSDAVVGGFHPDGPIVQICLSGGLWDAGAAITVGGQHIASWLIGQVRDNTQTEEQLRSYARAIDADEQAFLQALRDVPVMSQEKFRKVAQALFTLANQLSNSAYQNIQQARSITELRTVEAALRISEAKHKTMIGNISDVIAIMDQNGVLNYSSPNIEKWFGWQPEDLVGRNGWSLVHPAELEQLQRTFFDFEFQQNTLTADFRFLCKDGGYKSVELTASNLIQDPFINGILMNFHDITDRKQAEAAQRFSDEKFAKAFHISPDSININRLHDGLYLDINEGFLDLTGYSRAEVIGKTSLEIDIWVDPRDRARLVQGLREQGEVWNLEAPFRGKYGQIKICLMSARVLEVNGEPCILSVTRDISERKQAEEQIHAQLEELRRWHAIMIGRELRATELKREVNEWAIQAGQPPRYIDIDPLGFESGAAEKTGPLSGPEGESAPALDLQSLLLAADRTRQVLLSVAEDQRHAEDEVRQLNAELELRVRDRTAQLETANQEMQAFSYSVSHDLRAPLRALDGFSELLMDEYQSKFDEQGRHYLSRIREAAQHMSQLINDLLKLSRLSRSEFARKPVNLSTIAMEIAAEQTSQALERQVEYEIADSILVQGDPNLLKIALENLLNNAFKFTSQRQPARIQVGMQHQGGKPVYFVRDNGAGFDMAYANKLFAPFQRLHGLDEYPGTGIGLVIVQRIITRHGGRIWPEAAVNQGATFFFTLEDDV